MANEIAVIEKNWLSIAGQTADLPVPFEQDIFLLECHVARTMHVDDILIKTKDVVVGTALVLRREPMNERDELAILVETAAGEKIGYVPRKHNPILARLMDAGKMFTCKVMTINRQDPSWPRINVSIYMID